MNKKDIATSFLIQVSSGDVRKAYKQYVHLQFRHHNAYFKGDRESLLQAMEGGVKIWTGFNFFRYKFLIIKIKLFLL